MFLMVEIIPRNCKHRSQGCNQLGHNRTGPALVFQRMRHMAQRRKWSGHTSQNSDLKFASCADCPYRVLRRRLCRPRTGSWLLGAPPKCRDPVWHVSKTPNNLCRRARRYRHTYTPCGVRGGFDKTRSLIRRALKSCCAIGRRAGHQIIGVFPTGGRCNCIEPTVDMRVLVALECERLGVI